jgi:hypothetical protein
MYNHSNLLFHGCSMIQVATCKLHLVSIVEEMMRCIIKSLDHFWTTSSIYFIFKFVVLLFTFCSMLLYI